MRPARAVVRLALALVLTACAACSDAPRSSGGITVESSADAIRIASPTTVVTVTRSPYRLAFGGRDGRPLAAEADDGGVFWERAGAEERLGAVLDERALPGGVALTVAAGAAGAARVTIRFVRDRTAEVAIEPPAPETVDALGDRWQSPTNERIYGLTERLRDSPLLAPGTVDIPREDLIPVEAGSLDRRGERVEMIVTPTFSVYGPFLHRSRGYGLAVSGTTIGWFDVARDDPQQIAFRFETGNAPASRAPDGRSGRGRRHADQPRRRRRRAHVRAARHPARRLPLRPAGARGRVRLRALGVGHAASAERRADARIAEPAWLPADDVEQPLGLRQRSRRQRQRCAGARLPRPRRLLRVQGPGRLRALDRVQRVLRDHGDRRRRHARALGHADRARVRRGDDRDLPALHDLPRAPAAVPGCGRARRRRDRAAAGALAGVRLARRPGGRRPVGRVPARPRPAGGAGVAQGERAREVYLPAGSWRSLWDESQRFEGPVTATVDAPLDTIPVFVRGGAPAP